MTSTTRLTARLLALLLVGLAAGCTSTSSGDPRPADNGSSETSTSSERPQEIQLEDVDPCTLLPEADYDDYYLDEPGDPQQDDHGSDVCLWLGDVGYMSVTLVTYESVDAQKPRYGDMEPTDPIDGFPAYTLTLPGDEGACFTLVDVAEEQYVLVQVGVYGNEDAIPPVCEYAHQFASSVMSTLAT